MVIYSILNDEPAPVTSLRAGVPLEVDRILAKALAKDPESRYQHVDELLVDLRRLKAQKKSGGRISASPKGKPGMKKWGYLIAAAAVIVIALILVKPLLFPKRAEAIDSIVVLPQRLGIRIDVCSHSLCRSAVRTTSLGSPVCGVT